MTTPRYRYEGDARAVAAALADTGSAHATAEDVRKLGPFRRLTNLVAQACHGDRPPAESAAILAEAAKELAALDAARAAAGAILAEAAEGLGLAPAQGTRRGAKP